MYLVVLCKNILENEDRAILLLTLIKLVFILIKSLVGKKCFTNCLLFTTIIHYIRTITPQTTYDEKTTLVSFVASKRLVPAIFPIRNQSLPK
jgi:hypothetical protein